MTDKESIIQKIQKLLAMSKANGASENEAMTAANRVQKLLQEHNLSLGDIKDNEIVEPIDSESFEAEKDKWKSWIVSATAKLYFCTVYSSSKLDERYRKVKQTVFVGRKSNRLVAKSMADYFIDTIEQMAIDEFKSVPGSRSEINRMSFNFKQGCAHKLSDRLRERYKEINGPDIYNGIDNPDGLPKLYKNEKEANTNWLAKQGINLRSKTCSISVKDRVAFNRGTTKGANIGIDTQVNANSRRYLSA